MVHKKLTIIFKSSIDHDDDFGDTYKTEYVDASFQITNQHMILELHKENGKYVEGHVFDLRTIKSYTTK